MKIAIVMSTYNGEKYIIDQFESIRMQSVQPDEVIICDDGSSDSTQVVIQNYINEHNLNNWHFTVNEKNLGWKKNFFKLIDECDADLIFLSDQDDVWNKKKLELMIPPIENNNNINVLVCDWSMKNENLNLDYKAKKKHKVSKICFSEKFLWCNYPGCAYCIRKSYFNSIKSWWREWLPHDAFLFRNAMMDGSLYRINSNLIIHRMHGNNAGTPKNFTQQKDDLHYYKDVVALLKSRFEEDINNNNYDYDIIKKSENWLAAKEKYYTTRTFIDFLRLGFFLKFYLHFKSYIKEFFVANYK